MMFVDKYIMINKSAGIPYNWVVAIAHDNKVAARTEKGNWVYWDMSYSPVREISEEEFWNGD